MFTWKTTLYSAYSGNDEGQNLCCLLYEESEILNKYVAELYKHSESLSVPLYVGTDRAPAELQQRISNTRENLFFFFFFKKELYKIPPWSDLSENSGAVLHINKRIPKFLQKLKDSTFLHLHLC